jgi:hypothetical protein
LACSLSFLSVSKIRLSFDATRGDPFEQQDCLRVFLSIRSAGHGEDIPVELLDAWCAPFGLLIRYRVKLGCSKGFKAFILKSDPSYKKLGFLLSGLSHQRLEQQKISYRSRWRHYVLD